MQPLLDAVVSLLPSPLDCHAKAFAKDSEGHRQEIRLSPDPHQPTVAMAFKIVEDPYGTLCFMRLYQGQIIKGGTYYNQRTGRKQRIGRILRMHADQREEIDEAQAGDIVAVLGIDCASGDTYASTPDYCTLESMYRARAGNSPGHFAGQPRRRPAAEQGPAPFPPRGPHAAREHR